MLTKLFNKSWSLVPLYWILNLILLLLAGCGGNEITISLRPVSATPPVQTHGEAVRLRVDPSDESEEIIYKWSTMEQGCGEIQIFAETEPLAEYRPPENAQVQKKCTVKVEGVLNEQKVGTDYLEVEIIPANALAAAPNPPSPSQTSSGSTEPIEEPIQSSGTSSGACQSTRPPLGGPATDVQVEVTSHKQCEKGLYATVTLGGTYTGTLTGKEIWVLVYPTDRKYYPQTINACEQIPSDASDGVWETIVNFGGPPQQYDVIITVADTDGEASREFKKWLKNGCDTDSFPGYSKEKIKSLSGLTEVTAVTLSTE